MGVSYNYHGYSPMKVRTELKELIIPVLPVVAQFGSSIRITSSSSVLDLPGTIHPPRYSQRNASTFSRRKVKNIPSENVFYAKVANYMLNQKKSPQT